MFYLWIFYDLLFNLYTLLFIYLIFCNKFSCRKCLCIHPIKLFMWIISNCLRMNKKPCLYYTWQFSILNSRRNSTNQFIIDYRKVKSWFIEKKLFSMNFCFQFSNYTQRIRFRIFFKLNHISIATTNFRSYPNPIQLGCSVVLTVRV